MASISITVIVYLMMFLKSIMETKKSTLSDALPAVTVSFSGLPR